MKTLKVTLLALTFVLALSACGSKDEAKENDTVNTPDTQVTVETPEDKEDVAQTPEDTTDSEDGVRATDESVTSDPNELGMHPLRQDIQFEGLNVTVKAAQLTSEEAVQPLKNDEMLVLDILVKNTGTNPYDIDTAKQFSITDDAGNNYTAKLDHKIDPNLIKVTNLDGALAPGGVIDGRIVVDVKKSNEFLVTYTTPDGPHATWIVPVFRSN